MDAKDKKLLSLIDLNSREKEVILAKQLGTSKQVINYRLRKLIEEGYIKKLQMVPNLRALGVNIYANIYYKMPNVSKTKEKEIIDYLLNNKKVGYVALLGGEFDLSIVLVARNLQELEKLLLEITLANTNALSTYNVSLRTFGVKFPKKYLLSKKNIKNQAKKIVADDSSLEKIDEIDKSILKNLSINSRQAMLEISEELEIPFSTIRTRIKSLERKEIIAGYSALLDIPKMGYNNYKLFLRVKNKSPETHVKLLSFGERHPNITWIFKTIGDYDYELRIEVENNEKYQEILREIRSEFSDAIKDTKTLIIFNELKEDYSSVLESI